METLQAIHIRRSIRKYEDKPVSDELLRELLAAAMTAPSAGNEAPWQFIVVRDRELLTRVKDINPHSAMAQTASAAVLVCGDLSLEKYAGFWVQDCSAATQNMLLAATDRGLGAVWTGIYPMQDRVEGFQKLFKLPSHVIPLTLVVVGYPAQKSEAKDRFREDRVHLNTW